MIPLVSVIIPTYNRAYVISQAIESILNQTYTNFEIIVVDDGSSDDTERIVKSYGQVVRYIKKQHGGQAEARNVGLNHAKGYFIASLDSDDFWYCDYLQKSISYMQQHDLDMFFSNWVYDNGINNYTLTNYLSGTTIKEDSHIFKYLDIRKTLLKGIAIPSSAMIVKREAISFGWDAKVNIGDDTFLQVEMVLTNEATKVGFTKECLWRKFRDNTNICDGRSGAEFRKLLVGDLHLMLEKFNDRLTKQEKKIIKARILQNNILVLYSLLTNKRSIVEQIEISNLLSWYPDFKIFILALSDGLEKIISRRIGSIRI